MIKRLFLGVRSKNLVKKLLLWCWSEEILWSHRKNKNLIPPKRVELVEDCVKNFDHEALQESEAIKKTKGSTLVRWKDKILIFWEDKIYRHF